MAQVLIGGPTGGQIEHGDIVSYASPTNSLYNFVEFVALLVIEEDTTVTPAVSIGDTALELVGAVRSDGDQLGIHTHPERPAVSIILFQHQVKTGVTPGGALALTVGGQTSHTGLSGKQVVAVRFQAGQGFLNPAGGSAQIVDSSFASGFGSAWSGDTLNAVPNGAVVGIAVTAPYSLSEAVSGVPGAYRSGSTTFAPGVFGSPPAGNISWNSIGSPYLSPQSVWTENVVLGSGREDGRWHCTTGTKVVTPPTYSAPAANWYATVTNASYPPDQSHNFNVNWASVYLSLGPKGGRSWAQLIG